MPTTETYKGNSHCDEYSHGRDKGFIEGLQHAINIIFQQEHKDLYPTVRPNHAEGLDRRKYRCELFHELLEKLNNERNKLEQK